MAVDETININFNEYNFLISDWWDIHRICINF